VNAISFSPDGKRLGVITDDGSVVLREVVSGKEILKKSFKDHVTKLAFSADGHRIVTSSREVVHVLETSTGESVAEIQPSLPKTLGNGDGTHFIPGVIDFSLSPDGQWLAIATSPNGSECTIGLWHSSTGRYLATLAEGAKDVVFSSSGSRIAILANDGTVRLD